MSLQDTADLAALAYKGLVNALVRILRRESSNTGLVSLDIRQLALHPEATARVVTDVVRRRFLLATEDVPSSEPEFAYGDDRILIPRV